MNYFIRISRLQNKMEEKHCSAFLVTNLVDIFYLTGLVLSAGKILVTSEQAILMVDGRYIEVCRANSPIPVVLAEKNTLWDLLERQPHLAIDSEAISYQSFLDLQEEANKRSIILTPLRGMFQSLRAIKESEEIAKLKDSANLCVSGFEFLLTQLKEGVSEQNLATRLEQYWKNQGRTSLSFEPIIAFGANSSMPHYRAGNTLLKKGDLVLIDIGVALDHYHSDMTRVVFFGEENAQLKEIYEIVLAAFNKAIALCQPGTLIGDLDEAARSVIREAGYGDYFNHSLGHGVGLEVHEFPIIKQKMSYSQQSLQEGMVITVEPGIYLPEIGGIRIEDTIVITKDGCESLIQSKFYHRVYV
ncbi:Xaa-Pro dipeptidase [Chlamydiales bacterium STE3]|nr:Xaa-Pro dipeptidase [Chlamydiales bacterium STE3]